MLHLPARLRRLLTLLGQAAIAAGTIVALQPAAPAAAQAPPPVEEQPAAGQAAPDFDIRDARTSGARRLTPVQSIPEGLPGVSVEWNDSQGVPASLIRYGGFLTEPSDASPEAIARGYLAAHAGLFRLGPSDSR